MSQRNPLEGGGGGGGSGSSNDGADDEQTQSIPDDPLRGPGGNTVDPGADDGTADGPSDGGSGSAGGGMPGSDDPFQGPGGDTSGPDPSQTPRGGTESSDGGGGTGGTTDPRDPLRGPGGGTAGPDPSQTPRGGTEPSDGGGGTGGTIDPRDPLRRTSTGGTAGPDPSQTPRRDTATGTNATTDASPTDGAPGPMADWRREYASQYERFGPEDVAFRQEQTGGGSFAQPYIPESTVRQTLREDVASQSEYVDPSDVVVSQTEQGGYQAEIPQSVIEENRRDALRQQAAEQYGVSPEEIVIVREGDQLRAGVRGDAGAEFADGTVGGTVEGDFGSGSVTQETTGQQTVRGFDPDADRPSGLGEVVVDVAQRTAEDPVGYVGGGTADFLTETARPEVDEDLRNEQVSMPGYDVVRGPVQGAAQWWDENVAGGLQSGTQRVTGSAVAGQVAGGVGRGVNPAGAVDAGLGVHESAAYVTAGAFEGPSEFATRAGSATDRGFYVYGRGIQEAQDNPAQAAGMVAGGVALGTAASAGARAGVSGARAAAGRVRGSRAPERVGGTDVRSGAPDPWEGVDPSRPLREQGRSTFRRGTDRPDTGRAARRSGADEPPLRSEIREQGGLEWFLEQNRQLIRSERGQAQVPRGRQQRQRGGGQQPQRRGGTTDDVRQDALRQYQDYLDDVAARERAATRRGVDPGADPIGRNRPQATYDPDAPQVPLRQRPTTDVDASRGFRVRDPAAEATGMLAAAQRQEVMVGDTFDAQEEALGLRDAATTREVAREAEQMETVQDLARDEATRAEVLVEQDAAGTRDDAGALPDTAIDVSQAPGSRTRERTATGQRESTAQTTATTTTTSVPPFRPPPTTTTGQPPTTPPTRTPGTGRPPRAPGITVDPSATGSPSPDESDSLARDFGEVDRDLAPGWGAEAITVAADPGVRDVTPSQAELEREFTGVRGAQELPTRQLLDSGSDASADGGAFDFWSDDDDEDWGGGLLP